MSSSLRAMGLFGIFALCLGVPRVLQAHHPVLTLDLANAVGAYGFTVFFAINERNQIVGADISTGESYVLSNLAAPTRETLACPESPHTIGTALNRRGEVVGHCTPPAEVPLGLQGFVRTAEGTYLILRHPEAVEHTAASGMNARRHVVGTADDGTGRVRGWRWVRGRFQWIDLPWPDVVHTMPAAINDDGDIAGTYLDAGSADIPDGQAHGFLIQDGVATRIEVPLPDATYTAVLDLNNQGHVLGHYVAASGSGNFFYEEGTYAYAVIPGPQQATSFLHGLNSRGRLVGGFTLHDVMTPRYERGLVSTWDASHAEVMGTQAASTRAVTPGAQEGATETPQGFCAQMRATPALALGKWKGLARLCQVP